MTLVLDETAYYLPTGQNVHTDQLAFRNIADHVRVRVISLAESRGAARVSFLSCRARQGDALPRGGTACRATPLAGQLRRPCAARRGARPAAADGRAGRAGSALQIRRHPPRGPS